MSNFVGRDIISIRDLAREDLLEVLRVAARMEDEIFPQLLAGTIMGTLFFEPSTRTRLSFESAVNRLGGQTLGFADVSSSSVNKGESLFDTIKMVQQYCQIIVIRHPLEGAARLAAEASRVPVINGGDGANQHPTQTLLDLYTIQKTHPGGLEHGNTPLRIVFAGDLRYGRAVHSLVMALSHFNCYLYFVSPESLRMPVYYLDHLQKAGISYEEHERVESVIDEADILYATRIQRERFPDPLEYARVQHAYVIQKSMLKNVRENLRILHPLPRVDEISRDVDDTPYAFYFQQAGHGIPVRQALLALVLGAFR